MIDRQHDIEVGARGINDSMDTKAAIELLNSIKSQYDRQVKALTGLKTEVTRSAKLEQAAKSKMRIQIESLLIDLNEEIFAISEDLAAAF